MTTTTAKGQIPVGSREWISAEKENVQQLVRQEMEEVEYPVRHEMEWLNEHMAEIFRGDQLDVTEVFKTPGKMRGKTPRTIRKHQTPKTERAPLTEIFSASQNKNSPVPNNHFNQEIQKLASQKDKSQSPLPQNQNSNPNFNTDSGYHGMPDEDDMQMIPSEPPADSETTWHVETATQPLEESTLLPNEQPERSPSPARRATEDSFHSAREVAPSKETTVEPMDFEYSKPPAPQPPQQPSYPKLRSVNSQEQPQPPVKPPTAQNPPKSQEESSEPTKDRELEHPLDDLGSASESSTPERPPIRKSSLTFASLPAREPLTTTKRSMGGARMSRISHVDRGVFGRQTGGSKVTQALAGDKNDQTPAAAEKMDVDELYQTKPPSDDPDMKLLHNKSSTQRLHEKINMLGNAQSSRNTKSISAPAQQVPYPDLPGPKSDQSSDSGQKPKPAGEPAVSQVHHTQSVNSQSESQLQRTARQDTAEPEKMQLDAQPSTTQRENTEPRSLTHSDTPEPRSPGPKTFNTAGVFHGKSNSTSSMLGSPRPEQPVSRPNTAAPDNHNPASTTPTSSPKRNDGPLSASKSRLRSIMGAARGLFTSTGGASAAARIEALSPTATRTEAHASSDQHGGDSASPPKAQYSSPTRQEARRTRSSTEREARRKEEEELKEKERKDKEEEFARAREEEKQKAAQSKNPPVLQKLDRAPARKIQPPSKQAPREHESSREEESKTSAPTMSKQKDTRRPVKPTKEMQKPKPQPVSIRVGTHSQRMAMSQHQAPPSSVPEPTQQPSASKQPSSISKKDRAPSLQTTTSANSLKSNNSSASMKSKATQAAERKKEQETQKKLEKQQQEVRQQGQAESSERQERDRAAKEDPKKIAQRQAIEKRRLENAKKLKGQHNQQAAPQGSRVSTQHQEHPGYSQQNDLAPAQPPSRLNSIQPSNRPNSHQPPPNPAKPPKRNVEDEGHSSVATAKPGVVKQADGKRRKTDEESAPEAPPTRPTMAPPIRQSNARKDTMKPGYATAPAQHPQGGPAMFKNPAGSQQFQGAAPSQAQRSGHPLELAKYASGKIPFAESNAAQPQPPHYTAHKNPAPLQQKAKSPAHPNGDSIKLPEIPTDSEESDSDAEVYNVPDWAREENLGNILMEQEGHDGDAVFGPSAPLYMEEIFKENKERFKRFRDRTSSANWAATGDGLTTDEVRWDLAEREKLKQNGGWTYGKNSS